MPAVAPTRFVCGLNPSWTTKIPDVDSAPFT
jgi:hypothetical protein